MAMCCHCDVALWYKYIGTLLHADVVWSKKSCRMAGIEPTTTTTRCSHRTSLALVVRHHVDGGTNMMNTSRTKKLCVLYDMSSVHKIAAQDYTHFRPLREKSKSASPRSQFRRKNTQKNMGQATKLLASYNSMPSCALLFSCCCIR